MRCTIPSVNCTLRIARALNDPYGSNELNFPLADRYSAGVLDMTAMLVPIRTGTGRGVSIQISKKLSKKISPHNWISKNCCDLNLLKNLCICTFFLFPDPGLYLLVVLTSCDHASKLNDHASFMQVKNKIAYHSIN